MQPCIPNLGEIGGISDFYWVNPQAKRIAASIMSEPGPYRMAIGCGIDERRRQDMAALKRNPALPAGDPGLEAPWRRAGWMEMVPPERLELPTL